MSGTSPPPPPPDAAGTPPQNLIALRFANPLFGAVWNRRYVSNVQITFKETIGTRGRGGYFDQYGAARRWLLRRAAAAGSAHAVAAHARRPAFLPPTRSLPPTAAVPALLPNRQASCAT